jgi:hypothetical protein
MNTNECSSGFPVRDLLLVFPEQALGYGRAWAISPRINTDLHG